MRLESLLNFLEDLEFSGCCSFFILLLGLGIIFTVITLTLIYR